jgi:hypothetical protein
MENAESAWSAACSSRSDSSALMPSTRRSCRREANFGGISLALIQSENSAANCRGTRRRGRGHTA